MNTRSIISIYSTLRGSAANGPPPKWETQEAVARLISVCTLYTNINDVGRVSGFREPEPRRLGLDC